MSKIIASQALLSNLKSVIPQLSFTQYKGQAGKICVIGGSKEYTGAPYFAAISALYCGGDLVHVICPEEAAIVIKSYNPELIVHPILANYEECCGWLKKMHAVVIGPGLGRENVDIPTRLIEYLRSCEIPMVIDADAVHLVAKRPSVVTGYCKAILTPNVVEFRSLYRSVMSSGEDEVAQNAETCADLANKLGNVTIVMKGPQDIISDGMSGASCSQKGAPRRCGGQGDLLSGTMALMLAWCYNQHQPPLLQERTETLVAAMGACTLTRVCAELAYEVRARSSTTLDMIGQIGTAFTRLFEPPR